MPRGTNITERDRNYVLDMNAQHDADYRCRFNVREIAQAADLSHNTVARIIREYAAECRRHEHTCNRIDQLSNESS